jgi:hypothetical protein
MADFMPALFAATIFGLEAVLADQRRRRSGRAGARLVMILAGSALALTLVQWVWRNPFTFEVPPVFYPVVGPQVRPNAAEITAALARIQSDDCVVASNHLAAQLSQRRALYVLEPLGYEQTPPPDCDWVLADLRETRWGDPAPVIVAYQARGYTPVLQRNGVVLLAVPGARPKSSIPSLP